MNEFNQQIFIVIGLLLLFQQTKNIKKELNNHSFQKTKIIQNIQMKRIIIFLASLFAFSVALTADNAIINLQKIEKSRFGRNILDTIQLQLSVNDQIGRLVSDLQNIATDIQNDQAQDQKQSDRIQQDCANDVSRLEDEIQDANLKVIESTSDLTENTPILEQKKVLLKQKNESLTANQQILSDLDQNYEKKSGEYEAERQEHSKAESVIREAKEILQGTFGSVKSFINMKKPTVQSFIQVSNHFTHHSKTNYKRKSWNSFFRILSQLSQSAPIQADAGALQKLFEVIDELLEKIADSLEIEAKAFDQFEQDYENKKDDILDRIGDLQKVIGELDGEIQSLQAQLQEDARVKQVQQDRSEEKQTELNSRQAFCTDQQSQYESRTSERNEQLDTIKQVLDIINSQMKALKKYVTERSDEQAQ
ncbi:hypothetical protein ABPG74_003846 [Tetrahymena malaccensis]